jgi:hypothetical protein
MPVTSPRLSDSLQTLIDSRLDTIDRMLLGRVPRQDRVAIVRDVETQIHDLLQERDTEELSRDDVLAVLARLDPPEAYLPEEAEGAPASPRVALPGRAVQPFQAKSNKAARAGGIVGLASLLIVVLVPALVMPIGTWLESQILMIAGFFSAVILGFAGGVLGIVLAVSARPRGAWGLTGIVTGVFSLLASVVVLLMSFT